MPPTYIAPHRPFPLRVLNATERLLNRIGKSMIDYSESACIKHAQARSGLIDFGGYDFHTPLSMLIKSCQEDANLTFAGKLYVREMITKILINRLKIENHIKKHPKILERPIKRPLFIIGLPRTGTTLLHNLLAQDPNSRFLKCWEAFSPSPPPITGTADSYKRIFLTKAILGLKHYLAPAITTVKPLRAENAEECIILLGHSFLSHRAFSIFLKNTQYLNWLKTQDLTTAYQYYYRILQLLQWNYPHNHWILKAPEHLLNLGSLLNVFPDACLIQTHRDLMHSIPSSCSMLAVFRSSYSDSVDLKEIGQNTIEWMSNAVNGALKVRQSHTPKQFLDIHYNDLVRDPIGTVHHIYTYFGYTCSNKMDRLMEIWLKKNSPPTKAAHRYSLSQFDLNSEEIYLKFKTYYRRFQVVQDNHPTRQKNR